MTATSTAPTPSSTRAAGGRRRRGAAGGATLAVAIVLLLAGCSSSTEGSDPTTTAAPAGTGSPSGTSGGSPGTTASTTPGEDGEDATTTSEVGPLTTVDLDAAEEPYVDALVGQGSSGMTEAQTACLAGYTVRAIGVDALQAAGVTPEALASNEKSFSDLTIDEATATEMIDAFEPCSIDIVDYFLQGISSSVNDPAVLSCIEGRLSEDVARSLYITSISGGDANAAFEELRAPCMPK